MTRPAGVPLLLLLAACSGPPADPLSEQSSQFPRHQAERAELRGEVPPDNVLASDPQALIGTWYEWPPAGDRHRGDIVLRIDGKQMVANSDCATMAWTYRLVDGRLDMERAPVSSCVRGLTAREERFNQLLERATQAFHRGGRGLIFQGPKGRIVLHDQPSASR